MKIDVERSDVFNIIINNANIASYDYDDLNTYGKQGALINLCRSKSIPTSNIIDHLFINTEFTKEVMDIINTDFQALARSEQPNPVQEERKIDV